MQGTTRRRNEDHHDGDDRHGTGRQAVDLEEGSQEGSQLWLEALRRTGAVSSCLFFQPIPTYPPSFMPGWLVALLAVC